jgi:Mrp family chromosome partitioning ATPase
MSGQVPSSCPGVQSEQAGQASGCAGCPNQSACSSGKTSDEHADQDKLDIATRLADVQHVLLVLSGKGGVGKSTVSGQLCRALATDSQCSVGLLDVDICGPSAPRLMGLEGEQVHTSNVGWSPVYVQDNLAVMSCGFLLDTLDESVVWRGPKKNGLIKQFLRDVDWGHLDYLLVDTPPGTSDEHLALHSYLGPLKALTGAILVSTPQEAALLDVRKQIDFCRRVNLPIVGLVENMSGFVCPSCKGESQIWRPTTGGVQALCEKESLPLLGRLPVDPLVARCCDQGEDLFEIAPDSSTAKAYLEMAAQVKQVCRKP